GLGQVKWRYEVDTEQVPETPAKLSPPDPLTGEVRELAPAIPAHEAKTAERVCADYVHWKDFRWSPCRVWDDCRWVAYRLQLTESDLTALVGEKVARAVPLNSKKEGYTDEEALEDPCARADVWEIWSKEDRKRYYFHEGYPVILRVDEDPLGLAGFFPSPEPLLSVVTTTKLLPVPFYCVAQDLYRGCDELYRRICLLEEAMAVRGFFDKDSPDLKDLLNTRAENFMVPVKNWAAFVEKGGLKGAVDFVPLDMIASALNILSQKLAEKIQLLQQVTGMSDIMRGQAASSATATEQAIKAKFGSIRGQSKQKDFSTFATDALRIKAEIIALHFDAETIVRQSNMETGHDAQLAPQAAQLVKDKFADYRIEIEDEQVSMQDMAALKSEKMEFLGAVVPAFQQALQASQVSPEVVPMLLEMVKWALAGFKGASTGEAIIDQGIAKWTEAQQQKAMQPPPPDPKLIAAQVKAKTDIQKSQMDMQRSVAEHQMGMREMAAEAQLKQMDHAIQLKQAALTGIPEGEA
ncbi:MAG TPA: hypothetical protein VEJ18_17380, partial [Planctomycetota bacterium]|nr:hypothetical protein [Planctomycetota bacterium]